MLHHMKLQQEPFRKVMAGNKTIELRLNDTKRQRIRAGDQIEFLNLGDRILKIRVCVVAVHHFESFEELYRGLPLSACGYGPDDRADPKDMEQYYSVEEQERWGVVGIEMKLLPWRDGQFTGLSRYLSLILRHHPEAAGISLDEHGWADVDQLIQGINKTRTLTKEMLEQIVLLDEKQRYSFSEDQCRIRANQGHSIPVDLQLKEKKPPDILWHGTAVQFADSINRQGLVPMTRLYVHLSADRETALKVGQRHGRPVIYQVNAEQMYRDGYGFFRSKNKVWLTQQVPVNYIQMIEM